MWKYRHILWKALTHKQLQVETLYVYIFQKITNEVDLVRGSSVTNVVTLIKKIIIFIIWSIDNLEFTLSIEFAIANLF